ncbi:hypothetical protein ACSHWG_00840 [Leucobacter sp. Z1108]|uniref:hypothetical protein n=1 Tax=Leucobacter sp. Z1108 TaxID=3439066 RepID=UPI003F2C6841
MVAKKVRALAERTEIEFEDGFTAEFPPGVSIDETSGVMLVAFEVDERVGESVVMHWLDLDPPNVRDDLTRYSETLSRRLMVFEFRRPLPMTVVTS